MMMAQTVLKCTHLSAGYKRGVPVLEDVNLSLHSGQVVSMIGGNGLGKSTLLKTLSGLLRPLSGEIYVTEKNITAIPRRVLATKISLNTHAMSVSGGLTVRQFVELARQPFTGAMGLLSDADKAIVLQALKQAGIEYKMNSYTSELSDGERQKAMIARALAQDTPILMLDEPFSYLDPAARVEAMLLLQQTAHMQHKAVLLTCHDISLSMRMSDRLWLLTPEHKVIDVTPKEALRDRLLDSLYRSEHTFFNNEVCDFVVAE